MASIDDQYAVRNREAMTDMHLKGAKFSTPSSEMVETKAIGLGTMPLIISVYSFLWHIVRVAFDQ